MSKDFDTEKLVRISQETSQNILRRREGCKTTVVLEIHILQKKWYAFGKRSS